VQVTNAATGQLLASEKLSFAANIQAIAFSKDGNELLMSYEYGRMAILRWNSETRARQVTRLDYKSIVAPVAFAPGAKILATASRDKSVRLWDVATGKQLGRAFEHSSKLISVAFNREGTMLATGSDDGIATIWDLEAGTCSKLTNKKHAIPSVAFSPDSSILATGTSDNTAELWDLKTGKSIGSPLQHKNAVRVVAFSPDGTKLATGSFDLTARLWDVASGRALGDALPHVGWVNAIAFNHDGSKLATSSWEHAVRIWDIPGEIVEPANQIYLWVETMTGATVNDAGVLRQLTAEELQNKQAALQKAGGPPRAYLEALEKQRQNRSTP
jgi:WD40 repeat protein